MTWVFWILALLSTVWLAFWLGFRCGKAVGTGVVEHGTSILIARVSRLLSVLGIPPEAGTLSERVEIALKRVKEASGG